MKSAKIFFVFIASLLIISGFLLVRSFGSAQIPKPSLSLEHILGSLLDDLKTEFSLTLSPSPSVKPSLSPQPQSSPNPVQKPSPTPTNTPATTKQNQSQPKTCYRYTVPHLDGSSSTQCYTQADYQTLVSLGIQYQSAKADYAFQTAVASMYSDGSEFFKKSADEARAKAQSAQNRIGEISLQMYAIESRGW